MVVNLLILLFYSNVSFATGANFSAGSVPTSTPVVHVIVDGLVTKDTGSLSNISNANATTDVLSSNPLRQGLVLSNDSTTTVYIAFGSGALSSAYTFLLSPGAVYFMSPPIYTGRVTSFALASTGTLRVTEL